MGQKRRGRAAEAASTVSVAAAGHLFGPAASATLKLLDSVLLQPLTQHVAERRTRRAEKFVEEFMESGHPAETARFLLESEMRQASAETKDAILDSLRTLDDVVSDEVVPALAILAREYLRANRGKDRFLVGVLRLLRDVEDGEYTSLRRLVNAVTAHRTGQTGEERYIAKIAEPEKFLLWMPPNIEMDWEAAFDPLMRNLTIFGFATISTGFASRSNEAEAWLVNCEPWKRLRDILGS